MKYKNSIVVIVFNRKGEVALQLRAAEDKDYPLHWDFSAGGGIDKEELPENAAIREIKEEIGINAKVEYIGKEIYADKRITDTLYIYKTEYNGKLNPNYQEVAEVRFFTLADIMHMIEMGEQFHPEFIYLWNKGDIKPNN